jgi:AcrR family transcriptional regulator
MVPVGHVRPGRIHPVQRPLRSEQQERSNRLPGMISGSRTSRSKRTTRRQAMTDRLLASVEQLLEEQPGYTDLNVEEIIQRAGVPRSTFYYNFRDKGDLLVALSESAVSEIVGAADKLYAVGPSGSYEEFAAKVRETVQTWRRHVGLMNALGDAANYDPDVKAAFLACYVSHQEGVAAHIRAGQADGYVRPQLDPERTAAWLTWMAERGMSQLIAGADEGEIAKLEESLTSIVWFTLYPG